MFRTQNLKFRILDFTRHLPAFIWDLTQDLKAKTSDLLVACKTMTLSHFCCSARGNLQLPCQMPLNPTHCNLKKKFLFTIASWRGTDQQNEVTDTTVCSLNDTVDKNTGFMCVLSKCCSVQTLIFYIHKMKMSSFHNILSGWMKINRCPIHIQFVFKEQLLRKKTSITK